MAEAADKRVDVDDTHRAITFAFMQMLRGLKLEHGNVEAAIATLQDVLDVDPAGMGGQHDKGIDLVAVCKKALDEAGEGKDGSPETEEKFKSFLELLKKKGYFTGAEEGSDEFKARMAKARTKFNARNNPYEGLSAEELKAKGNELMQQDKLKEAMGYYTKAIEKDPSNHLYFANRAAAHLKLQDYHAATSDSEKAIALNDKYAKAYVRLGTASYYLNQYRRAADAYGKAVELEPANEQYKEYLQQARDKIALEPAAGGAPGGMPAGFPGFPGMPGMGGPGGPDFGQMMSMMNNPEFMSMATKMMANPEFSGMVQNMAKHMGMAQPSPDQMNAFMEAMQANGGRPVPDADGNIRSPFGTINHARMEKLREEEMARNPKFKAVMDDVKANGPAAMNKHMADPEVMAMMHRFSQLIQHEAAVAAPAEHADPAAGGGDA